MNKSPLFYLASPQSQNNDATDMQQELSRDRFLSEPERFTFGYVSTERETEEESSSCFDYTSDQVREVFQLHWCFDFSSCFFDRESVINLKSWL